MDWYYARNNQQQGPVSDVELAGLVTSNIVTDQTLVWHAGLDNWRPYGSVKQAEAPPAPPPTAFTASAPEARPAVIAVAPGTAGVTCCECGQTFPPDQVVQYQDRFVCAGCKPVFLQRVAEGAAFAHLGACTEEQLAGRDYDSPIASCLSRGWTTYRANFGPMLGTMLLMGLIMLVVNGTPYLSMILSIVFNGPLGGGLWNYFVRHVRNLRPMLSDAFSGFSPQFGQLLLAQLVSGILCMVPVIPGAVVLGVSIVVVAMSNGQNVLWVAIIIGGALVLAGIVASWYLRALWMYALPLIADKKMSFWPAMQLSRKMVAKHWWSNFGLIFLMGLASVLPLLVLGGGAVAFGFASDWTPGSIVTVVAAALVGLGWMLFWAPFSFSVLATRYNDIFGDLAPQA